MYGPRFLSPDAANSADIHQASNVIASEGTHEDDTVNRRFGGRKPSFALFLKYLNSQISEVS